ncbi:MAG: hypothetical protein IIC39_06280 [Candidatus Marinimicrobia bacterium]|nr:hypothetical protein [Candidatus Neomarinimicrobiota bacterium]
MNDVVAILLGDGRGNFSEPQYFPVGLAPLGSIPRLSRYASKLVLVNDRAKDALLSP